MRFAHSYSLNVLEQGVAYAARQGAELGKNFAMALLQATAEEGCAFVS